MRLALSFLTSATTYTETVIATGIIDLGISPQEIVLAFHHPNKRPLTDFAAA